MVRKREQGAVTVLPSKWGWAAGILLGLMYFGFMAPRIDIGYLNSDDPVSYLLRADSLLHGKGYGEAFENVFYATRRQPPGFSLMLVPLLAVFGMNFFALKFFMVLASGAMAFSFYYFFRHFLNGSRGVLSAVLFAMASPAYFLVSHRIMAEVPLVTLACAALWMLDRGLRTEGPDGWRWILFSAAAAAGAHYIKPMPGLLLSAGAFVFMGRSRLSPGLGKAVLFTAVSMIPVLVWNHSVSGVPASGFWGQTYRDDLFLVNAYDWKGSGTIHAADLLLRLRHNLVWGMVVNAAAGLVPPLVLLESGIEGFFLGLPVAGYLAMAWVRGCRRLSVLEIFAAAHLGICALKIDGHALRYVAVAYPVFWIYFFRDFAVWSTPVLRSRVFFTLLASGLVTLGFLGISEARSPFASPVSSDYVRAAEFMRDSAPADSRCLAPMNSHWQVMTGHSCFEPVAEGDFEKFLSFADYVVIPVRGSFEVPARGGAFPGNVGRRGLDYLKRLDFVQNHWPARYRGPYWEVRQREIRP